MQTLRRLGKAMLSDRFKTLHYNLSSREHKDLVGTSGIRERIMHLLNIRISDRDVCILMTRFDRGVEGTVDLVDILGNAQLYYARQLQEQQVVEEAARLKVKNDSNAKQRRIARNEERAILNKMLSSKLVELEKDYGVLDGINDDDDVSVMEKQDIDPLDKDLESVREFAYNALKSQKLRYLDALANKISMEQFREILYILGMSTEKVISMLLKKYASSDDGIIDALNFKTDFKSLASYENHRKKQMSAVSSFYQVLIDTKPVKNVKKKKEYLSNPPSSLSSSRAKSIPMDKDTWGSNKLNAGVMQKRAADLVQVSKVNSKLELIKTDSKLFDDMEAREQEVGDLDEEDDEQEDTDEDDDEDDDEEDIHKKTRQLRVNLSEQVLRDEERHDEDGDYEDSFESMPPEDDND